MSDLPNRRTLAGDPDRLSAAAAVLRRADAQQVFVSRFPGEFVMSGVARLLDAVARGVREGVPLGHDVVAAATDIAEHVLAYVQPDRSPLTGDEHRR